MSKEQLEADRCHARAVGSYLSGLPDSSDIDMLLAAPPSATAAASQLTPGSLLHLLLLRLQRRGHVTNDVALAHQAEHE